MGFGMGQEFRKFHFSEPRGKIIVCFVKVVLRKLSQFSCIEMYICVLILLLNWTKWTLNSVLNKVVCDVMNHKRWTYIYKLRFFLRNYKTLIFCIIICDYCILTNHYPLIQSVSCTLIYSQFLVVCSVAARRYETVYSLVSIFTHLDSRLVLTGVESSLVSTR